MEYLALTIPGIDESIQIQGVGGIPTGGFTGSGTGNSIIGWAIQGAFVIAVVVVLFMIVWGGIQYVTSAGNKEKVQAARNRILYSILGLVLIFLSVFLVNILLTFLGAPWGGGSPQNVNNIGVPGFNE